MQSQILPSRAALVNRIELQFEYGQNLICLIGASGLGKSYLAESFITDKYAEFNKAFIKLSANSKDIDLTVQLLQHSFRSPLIDQTLTLSENFVNLHNHSPSGPCLWVLDGARHLSDEMIAELQNIAKQGIEKIYILVTAQSPMVVPQALDLHLEPLSLSESKTLMKMFFKQLPVDEDPIFQTFLSASHGNPAILLDWQPETQQLEKPGSSKFIKMQWHLTLLTVLLALLMVAFVYQKEITSLIPEMSEEKAVVNTVLPSTRILKTPLHSHELIIGDGSKTEISDDVLNGTAGVSIGDALEVQNKTETSAIFSALTHTPQKAEVDKIVTDNKPKQLSVAVTSELRKEESAEFLELNEVVADVESVSVVDDHLNLLSEPDSNWVIQLLAVKDKAIAEAFISAHEQRVSDLKIYGTNRADVAWWIVIQSGYSTIDAAKIGKAKLPKDLLTGQPFFKKQTKIKQEIALFIR
ncbi:AAA family ATPase [Pseudoalteromonas aurantia]|uniref:DamX protein n=1 Tax=Pseudoalteromonas aurantia 208 TaxID=1314867 RepID=A0ABR9E6F6_9GAMM|nr:AAA family ATPase [Pseudoalteromonas aurantia]MBE0366568.1 DamX protein [Pseudoalteromonas aurantia 208]